ncbi:hypothetical protein [Micrococcus terreus]
MGDSADGVGAGDEESVGVSVGVVDVGAADVVAAVGELGADD